MIFSSIIKPAIAIFININQILILFSQVDFGSIIFPANFDVPMAKDIGMLEPRGHDVSSGQITVLDHKRILIRNFNFDGTAPGKA